MASLGCRSGFVGCSHRRLAAGVACSAPGARACRSGAPAAATAARLFEIKLVQQLPPFAVLLFGRAGEPQRAALDVDDLRRTSLWNVSRQLLERLRMDLRVRILLQARQHGGRAADGAGGARGILDAAAVVVVGRHWPGTNTLASTAAAPRNVRVRAWFRARVSFSISRSSSGASCRTSRASARRNWRSSRSPCRRRRRRARGCARCGWCRDRPCAGRRARPDHALRVLRQVAVHRLRARGPARSAARSRGGCRDDSRQQQIARGHHVVGDLRIDVLERIALLERRVGLVRAGVRGALVALLR